jgi:hypothetical protein
VVLVGSEGFIRASEGSRRGDIVKGIVQVVVSFFKGGRSEGLEGD